MNDDHTIAVDLANKLYRALLLNDELVVRLRVYYNVFRSSEPRVVHLIVCDSIDKARALLQACTPNATVHQVYDALSMYALTGIERYDAHIRRYNHGDAHAMMQRIAKTMNWSKESLFHLMIMCRTKTASVFVDGPAFHVPSWAPGEASARDNKHSIFAAYEHMLVCMQDKDPMLRIGKHIAIALPNTCEHCGVRSEGSVCGACMIVCFCSRECQRARFATHSVACPHFRKLHDELFNQ